jgi:hypothetical protein
MSCFSLSQVQKIVIWASLSLALLAVLYPAPVLYRWTGERWERSTRYQLRRSELRLSGFADNRRRLWGSDFYNGDRLSERPDYGRMATEVSVVLLIGGGLVVVLKGGRPTK